MADQQTYNPPTQPYQQFPKGGYQPAPPQFPSQSNKPFPTLGASPGYEYGATGTTVTVSGQPTGTPLTNTYSSPDSEQDYSGLAVCALVFSIITLVCCGGLLLCLTCSVPALILAVVALGNRGSAQKTNAGISIGLNVAVVVCTVLFLVIFIPTYIVTSGCTAYSTYDGCCIPDSYTSYYCTYYCYSGSCSV